MRARRRLAQVPALGIETAVSRWSHVALCGGSHATLRRGESLKDRRINAASVSDRFI